MLHLRLNELKTSSLDGSVTAQVLYLDSGNDPFFVTGLMYADGRALGMLTTHTGEALRRSQKADYIWQQMLKSAGSKLSGMTILNVSGDRNAVMIDLLITAYALDTAVSNESLDADRRDLLAKLQKATASGTARDTTDP